MQAKLRISEKLYATLLYLYPRNFREGYSQPMRLAFRDACRAACQQNGAGGLLALWLPTLVDLFKSALAERARDGAFTMSKTRLVELAGPLTVLVGAMWLLASIGELVILFVPSAADTFWDFFWFVPSFLSLIPLLFALIGTRLRFYPSASGLGRLGLALSVAGCAGMISFVLVSILLGIFVPQVEQENWPDYVMAACLLSLVTGYVLFGVDALRHRLLPRWNLLPLLLLGAAALFRFAPSWLELRNYHPLQLTAYFLHLAITGACWLLIGLAMIEQKREPEVAIGIRPGG